MIDFILGRRGHGKTTLAYYLASQERRTLVFDPRGQIRHHNEPESSAVATSTTELRRGVNALIVGDLTEVIFTPKDRPRESFAAFCREMARLVRGLPPDVSAAILIDEIRFADLGDEELDWVLRCSDMNRFRILFTGHRPKDVPTDIRGIGNRWMLFRFTLPLDFKVIEEHASPAVAARVKQLGPREFVLYDDSKDGYEVFKNPGAWHVPFATSVAVHEERPAIDGGETENESVDSELPLEAD
jgi:hypothetical protein